MGFMPIYVQRFLLYLLRGTPPIVLFNQGLFTHLRQRGVAIWVMGVDTPENLGKSCETGATAVLTNRPHLMSELLAGSYNLSDPS